MKRLSAGLLLYRIADNGTLEVLLGHMGGPFWAKKDEGAWSMPKGEYEDGDDPLEAAKREFAEELGSPPPSGPTMELGSAKVSSGKMVTAYALGGNFDAKNISSNTFEMEWPPRSGNTTNFPEVDRANWFDIATARKKLVKGQIAFLDRLVEKLSDAGVTFSEEGDSDEVVQQTLF